MQDAQKTHKVLSEARKRYKIETADFIDRKDLLDFFRLAYSGHFKATDYHDEENVTKRWEWANIKNPSICDGQFPSWFCIDNKDNKIVGHLGIIPVSLKYKNNYHSAAWGRDMIVPPECRKSGICSLMFTSILEKTKDKLGVFLLAGLNDYAVSIYKKLGFIHLGYIPLYVRVNKLGNIVQSRIRSRILARLLGFLGEGLLKIMHIPSYIIGLKYSDNSKIIVKEAMNFDKSFDKLWEVASISFSIIVKRDSNSLNWRFVNQPYWKYKIFKAENSADGETKGYVVLREGRSRGLRVGFICDLFAQADDIYTIAALVKFSVEYFRNKRDIDLIRCDILHKNFARVLKKFGFMGVRSKSHFMVANICKDFDKEFVVNRDNWFINYADCDLDLSGQR